MPRPVRFADGDVWRTWLVKDQRFVDGRPDVLTYVSRAADRAAAHRRRAAGQPVRLDQRHATPTGW